MNNQLCDAIRKNIPFSGYAYLTLDNQVAIGLNVLVHRLFDKSLGGLAGVLTHLQLALGLL